MSDEPKAPEAPKAPEETPQGGESPETRGILKDLQAERAKRQSLEADLQAMKDAQEERERKALEENEKWKELYEADHAKLKEYEPVVKEYADYKSARKEALLERLGKDAEGCEDWSVSQLEVLAKKIESKRTPSEPGRPGRVAGDGYDSMTYSELSFAISRGDQKARQELERRNRDGKL